MRIFRTVGVVASTAALLLASSTAFAAERPVPAKRLPVKEVKKEEVRPMKVASTTREESMKEVKERVEEKRAKAEERLSEIKDKKKQEMAQRFAKQIEELNKTWTDHFTQQLDRYDAVVKKIQDRAAIAAGTGKDVSATTAAVQSAKAAISTARAAVVAQAAKAYVLDAAAVATTASTTTQVGQEQLMKNLKNSFQELHKALFADLTALRDGQMTEVRKSVQSALQTLEKIPSVNEGSTASTTESR